MINANDCSRISEQSLHNSDDIQIYEGSDGYEVAKTFNFNSSFGNLFDIPDCTTHSHSHTHPKPNKFEINF